jgi:hypothetical protein
LHNDKNGFVSKNRNDLLREVDNIENINLNCSNYNKHGINYSTLANSKLHNNYKRYKLNYIKGDLFNMCNYSFVHCVGSDFRMGKGFAVEVRERYGNVTYLRSLGKVKGDVAILPVEEDRYIFYLVTKTLSNEKPIFDDLRNSLLKLKQTCLGLGVMRLAMPKIASGRDQIPWKRVQWLIRSMFANTDIKIDVYVLQYNEEPKEVTPSIYYRSSHTDNRSSVGGSSFTPKNGDFPVLPTPRKVTSTSGRSVRDSEAHATSGDAPMQSIPLAVPPLVGQHIVRASLDTPIPGESVCSALSLNSCTVHTTVPLQKNMLETEDLAVLVTYDKGLPTSRRSTREFEAHATSGDAPMQSFTSAVSPVVGLHSTSASPDTLPPGDMETASLLMNSCTGHTTINLQNNVLPTDLTVRYVKNYHQ